MRSVGTAWDAKYLPLSDKEGMAQRLLTRVMQAHPEGTRLLVLGDLNAPLDVPRTTQENVLTTEMAELDLFCSTMHYMSRTTRHVRAPERERR